MNNLAEARKKSFPKFKSRGKHQQSNYLEPFVDVLVACYVTVTWSE
jgi:hypothetical protein